MKIRYKGELAIQVPVEVDGVEPVGIGWLKRVPEDGRLLIYEPTHWEEVKPEPVWVDVTKECRVGTDGVVRHGELAVAFTEGYRFRKAGVWKGNLSLKSCNAFFVEKLKT